MKKLASRLLAMVSQWHSPRLHLPLVLQRNRWPRKTARSLA